MAQARIALLSRDARRVDELRRLCAVAGVAAEVASAGADVLRCWRSAAAVLVDAELADAVAALAPARRDRVALVGADDLDIGVWRAAVALGAAHVVVLPGGERFLVDWLAAGVGADRVGTVVGCLPGHGGAGASTLAVALAVAGADAGRRTALVDADPAGAGLDLLLGAEASDGLRWPDLAEARGVIDAEALAGALPTVDGVRLLSWDRRPSAAPPAETAAAVVSALRRSSDLVVVDLPGGLRSGADAPVAGCDAVIVVTATLVRSAAAAVLAAARAASCADVRVVVRRRAPARLRPPEVASALGLQLAGVMDEWPAVAAAAEEGALGRAVRRGGLASLARRLVETVAPDLPRAG